MEELLSDRLRNVVSGNDNYSPLDALEIIQTVSDHVSESSVLSVFSTLRLYLSTLLTRPHQGRTASSSYCAFWFYSAFCQDNRSQNDSYISLMTILVGYFISWL